VLVFLLLAGARTPGADEHKDEAEVLRELGVAPTQEGVGRFLESVVKGDRRPLTDAEADDLIARLGSDRFEVREKASEKLTSLLLPPLEKLHKASKNPDLEIAMRSRAILERLEGRGDPLAAVLRFARQRQIPISFAQLLAVIAVCENSATAEAAQDLLIVTVRPADLEQVRKGLEDRNVRIKAAAVRALGALQKENAVAELQQLLKHSEDRVRAAAARALVERGQTVDYKQYAPLLDAESLVLVLRAADKRFRLDNQNRRNDPKVMAEYQKLVDLYADALVKSKDVRREKKGPANTPYWLQLGLNTSKHPELLMYRIQWFDGQWSGWFVPGFNDREQGKGRDIRLWACFNDHAFEIVTTTAKDKYRDIQDLP